MAERKGPASRAGGAGAGKAKTKAKATKGKAAPRARTSAAKREREAREAKRRAAEMELAKDGLTTKPKGAAVTVENATTYLAVFSDWCKGATYEALAAKHKLGIRRCIQIVTELREARVQALQLGDPLIGLRLAQDFILHWRAAINEYGELANKDGVQDSVKIAALRERDRAWGEFQDLMQELGYMPRHLGTLRVQEDFLALVDALLDEMDKQKLSLEVQRALVEAVEMRASTGKDGRLRITAGGVDAESDAEEVTDAAAA